ncbi:LuxR C-terminal-related transcriptional regulator [Mycolicibacterium thermoresistibile]
MEGVRWTTAKRGPTWAALQDACGPGGRRGAVLVGPAGAGKTELARTVLHHRRRTHPRTVLHWVAGTASASRIPFGAFSHLVQPGGGEPATVLRTARDSLCGPALQERVPLLVVVDDAHHLDTLSATLVYQLAATTPASLLLTVRDGTPAPDAITALWKDELLARIDIEPFSQAECEQLLEAALGGRVESASAERLYAISEGNPLYLRHLVTGTVAAGSLREVEGIWQLRGEVVLTPQLSTLIDQHLSSLPEQVRDVLAYLAVEEPLTVDDLSELVSAHAVEAAESAGVVTVDERGGELIVHPAHPLYTETMRTGLGRLAKRKLRTALVARWSQRSPDNVSDRLRLAALAVDSETPPPATDLITTSWEAMQLGDLLLGERLARGALQTAGTPDRAAELGARLPLAHALAWQGRGREADAVLAAVDPDRLTEWDVMAWTLPKAANQFWMLSESAEAIALLDTMRPRLREPAAVSSFDALAATFAMNAGRPKAALELAIRVLQAPDSQDLAVAWAAATATLSSARAARFADVEPFAARGLAAQHPGLLRFTIGFGQITRLLMAGDLAGAEELARHYLSFCEFQQPGRAIGEVLLAHILIVRGALPAATALLRQAVAALSSTGYSWGPLAQMYLTQALGAGGDATGSARALRRAEQSHGMRSQLYAPELAVARAWTCAAARDVPGAVRATRDAAHAAEQSGQPAVALRALHDGVRLGDVHSVQRIARLRTDVDCVFSRIASAHARAAADRCGPDLDRVADDLAGVGMIAAAADAAAQAAQAHAAAGRRADELAARARAAEWAQRCGGPTTPVLEQVLNPLPLTGREREIAVMVSQGLTNKAIAERLCVSVRTVEGHIYRACIKLDVADRTLLAAAVAAGG